MDVDNGHHQLGETLLYGALWPEIRTKLHEQEQRSKALGVETEALDEADDGYDPIEFAEEDDEF